MMKTEMIAAVPITTKFIPEQFSFEMFHSYFLEIYFYEGILDDFSSNDKSWQPALRFDISEGIHYHLPPPTHT
jgi:hypothetical protein